MTDLNALTQANSRRWAVAKVTRVGFVSVAKHLTDPAAKARYQFVSAHTGVPWAFIAVVHEREASQNWNTQLGQGDPLHSISTHDPKGRGPFNTWEDGAIDALVNCGPHAARNKDWSIGGTLMMLEEYNGLGYAAMGKPSPYIWSGTDQYSSGKFVRDHVYDPNAVDQQLGCAGLLKSMMAIDASITFGGSAIKPAPTTKPSAPSKPSVTNPVPGSIGAFIASIFKALFGKKS